MLAVGVEGGFEHLAQIESRCGRQIVLAIEPEPGCVGYH